MIAAPNSLLGLGDGGAHVGIMCDSTATTFTLTHWTRDRARGALFPVSWIVKRLDLGQRRSPRAERSRPAARRDEGRCQRPGLRQAALRAPEIAYDLPAGGKRLLQRTEGIDATIVSGAVVYRHGESTGALPGRLIRGAR